jgi:hypothetical protein
MSHDFSEASPPRVPARRRRGGGDSPAYDDADLARGQAAAVLGVLGRMQLRLDVLAKEQAAAFARLDERLTALEASLSTVTDVELPPE